MAQLNFDANSVAPAEEFKPLPAGWYRVVIEEAELKPTSAGTGSYISMKLNVQDQQFNGRKVFANVTYQNPNQQATEIGQRQLSAICHAIGVLNLTDTGQLLNRPLLAKLAITAPTYNIAGDVNSGEKYPAGNDVKAWKAVEDGAPAAAANTPAKPATPPATPAATPAATKPAAPPWVA